MMDDIKFKLVETIFNEKEEVQKVYKKRFESKKNNISLENYKKGI